MKFGIYASIYAREALSKYVKKTNYKTEIWFM